MEAWHHIDLDAALAVLDGWVGCGVVVAVDTADGPPELAGMSGVLRAGEPAPGPDGGAEAFELEGSEAWFRVPRGRRFRGASYAPDARVLVMEFAGSDGGALLVDVHAR